MPMAAVLRPKCFFSSVRVLLCPKPTLLKRFFSVSILDAARNSLSFFLLLIVSLGLGVVREEIPEINKARLLGAAHALFGGKTYLA